MNEEHVLFTEEEVTQVTQANENDSRGPDSSSPGTFYHPPYAIDALQILDMNPSLVTWHNGKPFAAPLFGERMNLQSTYKWLEDNGFIEIQFSSAKVTEKGNNALRARVIQCL